MIMGCSSLIWIMKLSLMARLWLWLDIWTKSAKHEDLEYLTVKVRSEQSARTLLVLGYGMGSGVFATPRGQPLPFVQKGLVDWLIILAHAHAAHFISDRTVQFTVSLNHCFLNLNCCNMLPLKLWLFIDRLWWLMKHFLDRRIFS